MRSEKILVIAIVLCLTVMSCTKDSASSAADTGSGTGTGGSLARFTIASNHLYLADNSSLIVYNLANPASPVKTATIPLGFGVETIYPFGDKLFIGSMTGMFIYSITNPSNPAKLGSAQHVRSCDPVVANDSTAYVTLRGSGICGAAQDGLYIYDIKNVMSPVQKALLPLSNPYGLGLKDTVAFVCRGSLGLSFVNVKKATAPSLMYTLTNKAYTDVIPYNNLLICYVNTGLQILDISDLNNAVVLGEVNY